MNVLKSTRYGQIIYNDKDTNYGIQLSNYGEYCDVQARVFKEIVKKGNKVIEIGANYGSHTLLFSWLVGEEGVVHAFEPNRLPYYCLCGTIALNNIANTYCRQQMIGQTPGVYSLSELNPNCRQDFCIHHDAANTNRCSVKMLILAEVGPCDLVKISCNSGDAVVSGGLGAIQKYKPTLYITSPNWPLLKLHNMGYQTYLHIPRLFNDHNFGKNMLNILGNNVEQNLLAIHPDRGIQLDLEFLDLDIITDDHYEYVNPAKTETLFLAQQQAISSLQQLANVYDKQFSNTEVSQECLKLAEKLN